MEKNNTYCYDIEIYRNFFCVSFLNIVTKEQIVFQISQRKNDIELLYNFIKDKGLTLIGFNNFKYDDRMMNYLFKLKANNLSYEALCYELWMFSNSIINNQNKEEFSYNNNNLFESIDVQKILGLDKPSSWKSLKACAVNLKHDLIQDLPIPYDKEISENQIDEIIEYNINDIIITDLIVDNAYSKLNLRKELSLEYNVNLMNESDSSICNRILEKEYSDITNSSLEDFKRKRTFVDTVKFSDIIDPRIRFKSSKLNDFLIKLKNIEIKIDSEDNEKIESIKIGKLNYVLGLGGLHSETPPGIFKTNIFGNKIYTCDVLSYYPSYMLMRKIKSNHLKPEITNVLDKIFRQRVEAKANRKKTKSEGLKIVINSFYGKFLSKYSWLYDPTKAYQVTINCQLFLLMLIEDLELNGIEVISANTDGIECYTENARLYTIICRGWCEYTGFKLEYDEYNSLYFRDINNYLAETNNGIIKTKGIFDTNPPLNKSVDFPIISIMLYEYFLQGRNYKKITQRLHNYHITDFCGSQKIGGGMIPELHSITPNGLKIDILQKTNRYYVSKEGGYLYKRKKVENKEVKESNQLDLFNISEIESVENSQLISVLSGKKIKIVNDLRGQMHILDFEDIDFDFYINECDKIVKIIENKQEVIQLSID